ncbi:S41 family peptidase [Aerosticca soli]|uniref:Carboxyl-terminal protease n=1 Tax=Aerosticca soli TaxID=2010829 RepID=A0A2Z6E8N2_9GAMM|nr:S41 family peptidase [Aerosticca soli]BBD80859.1 carboxyl-terminal protease [Aerosticca soli]
MRLLTCGLCLLLTAAPVLHGQDLPATAGSAPATAASTAAADRISLDDIRNFSRVYEVIRQAYVEPVDNKTLMNAAISGMLSGLDPHSAYLDKEGLEQLNEDTTGQYSGLGIEVMEVDGTLRVIAPIDDTPASRAGIKPGDTIIKIDGRPVDADNLDDMFKRLRGEPGTKVTLTIVHENGNKPVDYSLVREKISLASVKLRALEPGYVYIRLSQFQEDTADDLERKLADYVKKNGPPKGAILDLRSNPGGLLTAAVAVSDAFLDAGTIVTTRGRLQDANMQFSAHPGDLLKGAPIVVLVDNGTASAAEIVAGALKDNRRALIMGRRTFGKGVVQTVLPLDADHAVKLTTARYYTPSGTSIQAEGIKPDIALADLAVNKADSPATLITSEADLEHHLANEKAGTGKDIDNDGSAENAKLATEDYALSQALNVLKAITLARTGASSAH